MTWLDLGELQKAATYLTAYQTSLGRDSTPTEIEDQYADAHVIPVVMGDD